MAELHRGVLGLSHRPALILAALLVASSASAQTETSVDDIERWAGELRSDDETARERAFEALRTLPESALPAIHERIRRTRRQEIPAEDGYDALRSFRHATGSRRADDMVDIADGILPVLQERRTRIVGRSAERVLLLRSLEGIGTVEAQRRIADIFSLTNRMWRWEQRRIVHRMGIALLPGMILARGHDDRGVRLWARGHIRNLGMKDPANALRVEDPELLASVINAYAEVRDLDTMAIMIAYVGHEDPRIRDATRAAFETFGRNGIWQLREGLRKQLGQTPDARWGWRRTSRELFEGLDAQRLAPYGVRVDEALAKLEAGDPSGARDTLDGLLRDVPRPPRVEEIASTYAGLADALNEPRLLRRALWLAPDAANASEWQRTLRRVEAEEDRAAGFVDAEFFAEDAEAEEDAATVDAGAPESSPLTLLGVMFLLIAAAAIGAGSFLYTRRRKTVDTRTDAAPPEAEAPGREKRRRKKRRRKKRKRRKRTPEVAEAIDAEPAPAASNVAALVFGLVPSADATVRDPRGLDPDATYRDPEPSEDVALDTTPGLDTPEAPGRDAPDTEPGLAQDPDAPVALGALLLARPEEVDTLPGVKAPR